jgi:hypothetical protein
MSRIKLQVFGLKRKPEWLVSPSNPEQGLDVDSIHVVNGEASLQILPAHMPIVVALPSKASIEVSTGRLERQFLDVVREAGLLLVGNTSPTPGGDLTRVSVHFLA